MEKERKFSFFLYSVIAVGLVVLIISLQLIDISLDGLPLFLIFLLLTLVAEMTPIHLPYGTAISVSFAVVYAAILLVSPPFAALTAFCGMTLATLPSGINKGLFNGSQYAISAFLSALVFQWLGGYEFHWESLAFYGAVFSSIGVFFLCNAFLVMQVISLSTGTSLSTLWKRNINGIIIQYFAMFPFSLLLYLIYINVGYWGIVLFFIPLMVARYSFKLYAETKQSHMDLLRALSAAIDAKDPYTRGHSSRVSQLALMLADRLRLGERRKEMLEYAALLHDVGKIGINDAILGKNSSLDEEEMMVVREHPAIGQEIIADISFLKDAATFVRAHHERCDGSGYPDRKKGCDIPVEAKILAVADVFDALTSDRPYRKAYSYEKALEIIENDEREYYDPNVVSALREVISEGEFDVS